MPLWLANDQERGYGGVDPRGMRSYLSNSKDVEDEIIEELQRRGIAYRLRDRGYIRQHLVTFLGRDGQGKVASAYEYAGEYTERSELVWGSSTQVGFVLEGERGSERLLIFSKPMELIQEASSKMRLRGDWGQESRLSLNGSRDSLAIEYYLYQHPEVKEVIFCMKDRGLAEELNTALRKAVPERELETAWGWYDIEEIERELRLKLEMQMSRGRWI